uniref:Uncharacterized protein n=1 Tax=Anguilla anguilla TaxID=7936 RepID=A0A0E9XUY8_ANGAN
MIQAGHKTEVSPSGGPTRETQTGTQNHDSNGNFFFKNHPYCSLTARKSALKCTGAVVIIVQGRSPAGW